MEGTSPVFHTSDLHLWRIAREGGLDLYSMADGGHIAMIAKAQWEGTR